MANIFFQKALIKGQYKTLIDLVIDGVLYKSIASVYDFNDVKVGNHFVIRFGTKRFSIFLTKENFENFFDCTAVEVI